MNTRYRKKQSEQLLPILVFVLIVGLAISVPGLTALDLNTFIIIGSLVIIGLLAVLAWWAIYRAKQAKARLRALQLIDIDHMEGIAFEHYVGELLKMHGYKTQFTPSTNDYGVDIIATKNGTRYAVQVKRYKDLVGRAAISDAVAGMRYYNCTASMVVTSSYFTPNAKELANINNCLLIDRDTLTDWIVQFQQRN